MKLGPIAFGVILAGLGSAHADTPGADWRKVEVHVDPHSGAVTKSELDH